MDNEISKLVRKNILNLSSYSSAREDYVGKEGIFLDANENPYGTYNRYPDPYQTDLKRKLAVIKKCMIQQIFIGNGSDEVIDLAFRIFCEPNVDKALTFVPTYGMYEISAHTNSVEFIKIPLNDVFQIDRSSLVPHLSDKNLKLIFICSPNNPTGNLLKSDDIEFILANFKGIVIIDEAYIDYSTHQSFIEKLDVFPNLIVIQTLSKAWGMAGIRIGIGYMNEKILAFYNKVKLPYNVSSVNQAIALKTLENNEEFHERIDEILSEKNQLIQEFKQMNFIQKIHPTDANFILIETQNADKLYQKLIDHQIIIRNRNSIIKNCLRITVGKPEENLRLLSFLKLLNNG